MKSAFMKITVVSLASLIAASGAYANWQCRMHNARGNTFYGVGPYRNAAASNAMLACGKKVNTSYAQNCVLDYCRAGNFAGGAPTVPVGTGGWYCTIRNAAGGAWTGYGTSRATASADAMGRCAGRGHSTYARNCVISYCGRR